jgi:hypothetical protein
VGVHDHATRFASLEGIDNIVVSDEDGGNENQMHDPMDFLHKSITRLNYYIKHFTFQDVHIVYFVFILDLSFKCFRDTVSTSIYVTQTIEVDILDDCRRNLRLRFTFSYTNVSFEISIIRSFSFIHFFLGAMMVSNMCLFLVI